MCVYKRMCVLCVSAYVCMLFECVYNADGCSVINTTSVISNPDDLMEFYSAIVTCEISPTSTAEYCEVFAGSGDTTLISKFTIGIIRYVST